MWLSFDPTLDCWHMLEVFIFRIVCHDHFYEIIYSQISVDEFDYTHYRSQYCKFFDALNSIDYYSE